MYKLYRAHCTYEMKYISRNMFYRCLVYPKPYPISETHHMQPDEVDDEGEDAINSDLLTEQIISLLTTYIKRLCSPKH